MQLWGAGCAGGFQRAIDGIKNNPGLSNVQIAEKAGVSEWTVRDAKKKSPSRHLEPEDDRPTIDKPPKGELWDVFVDLSKIEHAPVT